MHLKEIKLSGFKSFADKINIDFNKGITCVVGPNGSGKSNIVDAVRFVLGEQSVKSLRGDAMVDVIFSGSKSRTPLNVTSVELIFDNSDKHLALDYTEVSVKRRLYITGENEYFLNGQNCRLKDIVNLFVDSGMGRGSFNIISQGEIQRIISNKPEERRIVFEEVASVLKYKRRKEDAIKKIERTNENLNRVNDIIGELEPQIGPLYEQSIMAKEYLNIKEELENIEIALIVHDIDNINFEYQDIKKQIEKLSEEIVNLSIRVNNEELELGNEKTELQKVDNEIYGLQQQLIELSSKAEKLNTQKQMISERKKYDKEDIKLHNNIIQLKEDKFILDNSVFSVKSDINSNVEFISNIDRDISNFEIKLNSLKKEKSSVINQLDSKLRKERELNHKIDLLKNSIENNTTMNLAVRNVVNNPKLNGIHGIIGKLIEVEEKYALAIETSLGSSMQYIVVDNEDIAKDAINYLKNNSLGKATFFPINIIMPKGIDEDTLFKASKYSAYIGCAFNYIKCNPKYRNIVLNQLGNVLLVNDINGANEISKAINYRYKIVTLDGEIVHVGGSITGGTFKKSYGMIKEKYELESMLRDNTLIINECKSLENKINEIDYELKEIEVKIYNLQKQKVVVEESNNNKLKSLKQNQNQLELINNELSDLENIVGNSIDKEETKVITNYYETIKEKEELIKVIDKLNNKRIVIFGRCEEFDAAIRKNNSLYNKKQEELKNLEIKVNRMDVKLDTLLNFLTTDYSLTYDMAKGNYKLELDTDDARIRVNTFKAKIKSFGVINLGAIDEYERVNKRYTFLNSQRDDLKNALNVLLDIIKEMDKVMEKNFIETFKLIQDEFKIVFKRLFGGGHAELKLNDPSNILQTGIDIIASPPGKQLQHLSLLSGGEKSLTAIALLFAVLNVRPVPFCLFDEVEAALDDVNVKTFGEYLENYNDKTQFIIITHKKKTMEYANVLYGITMQESGVSKLVGVKLEDANKYVDVNK